MLQDHSFSFKGGFAYNLAQQEYKKTLNFLKIIKPQNKRKDKNTKVSSSLNKTFLLCYMYTTRDEGRTAWENLCIDNRT